MGLALSEDGLLKSGSGVESVLNLDMFGVATALFAQTVSAERLRHLGLRQIATTSSGPESLASLGAVEFAYETSALTRAVVRLPTGGLALVAVGTLTVDVNVACATREELAAGWEAVERVFAPEQQPVDRVPLTFWAANEDRRGTASHRHITAPAWADVAGDQAAATAAALEPLMAARGPGEGRLVLWHGPPGTGKTHAVRALTREWGDWCVPHFVSDPEVLLGNASSYLLEC